MTDMTAPMRIRAIVLEPDPIPMSAIPDGLLLRVDTHIRLAEAAALENAVAILAQIKCHSSNHAAFKSGFDMGIKTAIAALGGKQPKSNPPNTGKEVGTLMDNHND